MSTINFSPPRRFAWLRWLAALAILTTFLCGTKLSERATGQSQAVNATVGPRARNADRVSREQSDKARYREGAQIVNRTGKMLVEGDSATFVTEDGVKMGVLENLNLERIVRTLKTASQPDQVEWTVSGMATEYGGANYLLISRAVYKAASPSR